MNCYSCRFFDKNDPVHAYGTCEIQDKDFRCDHECNVPESDIRALEMLLRSR